MARFTCGKCKQTVDNVGHVRECYAAKPAADPFASIPVADDTARYPGQSWYALRPWHELASIQGDILFFRVTRRLGERGGTTYLQIQSGGNYLEASPEYARQCLTLIAAAPLASALLYGEKAERCSRCNTPLTHPDSRARRYGPDCYKKAFGGAA